MEQAQIILTIGNADITAEINPVEGQSIDSMELLISAQLLIKRALKGQEEKAPTVLASIATDIAMSKSTGDNTEEHS